MNVMQVLIDIIVAYTPKHEEGDNPKPNDDNSTLIIVIMFI